jgi:hypothetical protein
MRAHLCLGSWARCGLVTANNLVKAIWSDTKRKQDEDGDVVEDIKVEV